MFIQESLKYRLLGSEGDIGSWGHEYVRWILSYLTLCRAIKSLFYQCSFFGPKFYLLPNLWSRENWNQIICNMQKVYYLCSLIRGLSKHTFNCFSSIIVKLYGLDTKPCILVVPLLCTVECKVTWLQFMVHLFLSNTIFINLVEMLSIL